MRILVDSHIFLWAITEDGRLSRTHRSHYLNSENELYLSVACVWEMLIKAGMGKLPLPKPATHYVLKQMEQNRIELLPIRPSHLAELETLPPLHRDPFDRMTVAQAKAENMAILSADSELRAYGVEIL